MMTYLLSFTVFALALLGLSVGLLAGRGGIRGTCGGLNNPDGQGCGTCGRSRTTPRECARRRAS
jgi:hypothetical protein